MPINLEAICNTLDSQLKEVLKLDAVKRNCYFSNEKIYTYESKEPLKLVRSPLTIKDIGNVDFLVSKQEGQLILGADTITKSVILKLNLKLRI